MNPYLFVYGTLKYDARNPMAEFLRANAHFLGPGKMTGRLIDLGAYPGAIFLENAGEYVFGHVFTMNAPESILNMLDDYEGIGETFEMPHEYVREERPVQVDQEVLHCWVYLYNR